MNRLGAALALAGVAALLAAIVLLPWPVALLLLGLALAAAPRVLPSALLFAAIAAPIDALLFAAIVHAGTVVAFGPLRLGSAGALLGVEAALRLTALTTVALAGLARFPAPRLVTALRLPPAWAGTLGALVLAAHGVGDDWRDLVLARRADGTWPGRQVARARAAAELVPALVAASLRRAAVRRDALRVAGQDTGPWFVPLVAFGALAIAGRLLFLALPNVALTYVLVFLAGVLFGPPVGLAVGALAMGLTDLLLTGLLPAPFVNVPAMALLGLLGGLLRRLDWSSGDPVARAANRLLASFIGAAATLLFSLASDLLTWALLPEFRSTPGSLPVLLAAGLVFNVVPAALNAVLFAVAVPATVRAWRLAGPALRAPPQGNP